MATYNRSSNPPSSDRVEVQQDETSQQWLIRQLRQHVDHIPDQVLKEFALHQVKIISMWLLLQSENNLTLAI